MNESAYIKALESTSRLSEPAIRNAIKSLTLPTGSRVLDVPCGTGTQMQWMLEIHPKLKITGFDIAQDHIKYSKEKLTKSGKIHSCEFITGDMKKFEFDNNTFDLVWCCDGLWPGSKEMGCPSEEPYSILKDMVRITKPGGKIAILFWTSQKLLPGYPFLEATLNATKSSIMAANPHISPQLHFMRAPAWLLKAGLENIQTQTFAADINTPLNDLEKVGLHFLFDMFWGRSENEVLKETWKKYKDITNPGSEEYILNQCGYAGLLTYTMFIGIVPN